MGLIDSLLGKDTDYTAEYKRFKKSIERNPGDHGLKAEFIKFCLLNRFTKHEVVKDHIADALKLFDTLANADAFDLQCHYLVGKFYQEEKDLRKAYQVYLNAIKRFNQYTGKNPNMKSENTELAYSVALNLMTLQSNPVDPQVELCFRLIRKSFPLHLKRIELENEMAKPAPDKARLKQLSEEIRGLRAEEEKEFLPSSAGEKSAAPAATAAERSVTLQAAAPEKSAAPSKSAPEKTAPATATGTEKRSHSSEPRSMETPGIFSKLFNDLSPNAMGLTQSAKTGGHKSTGSHKAESGDSFQLSPSDLPAQGSAFLAFHDDKWEGPFTLIQLRSMEFFKPVTWVCRAGSQQVLQAYEVPDLQTLFQP